MRTSRFLKKLKVSLIIRVWPLARLWYRVHGLKLEGSPDHEVWYFAFGANMHDSAFRGRRGMHPLEWRPGQIRGYRLRFNLEGRPVGKAASANIARDPSAEVWGVLYRITRKAAVQLDASEGVPGRRYRPIWLGGPGHRRQPHRARLHLHRRGTATDRRPSLRYLTLLRNGARAHDLPEHWLRYLESVRHAE